MNNARFDPQITRTLPGRTRPGRCGLYLRIPGRAPRQLPRKGTLTLGSDPACDVVLDDRYISKRHAQLRFDGQRYCIEDLDSTNGTFLDGIRVRWAWLGAGQELRIGFVVVKITALGQPYDRPGPAQTIPPADPGLLLGTTRPMLELRSLLRRFAPMPHPVLLLGETGTGKELAAQTLHALGPRAQRPFVAVNCGAIPSNLAESELFGHVRGAFTGASRDHIGAFARAGSGTLFLDEVGELPLSLQAKLLRVLEVGHLLPVGAEQELQVHARVISATHRDPQQMMDRGELREDLYHRLGVLEVELPPLRDRPEDIPQLLRHFARPLAAELGHPVEFSPEAILCAMHHPWPGNVRALKNAVIRAAILGDSTIEGTQLLPKRTRPVDGRSLAMDAIQVPRGNYAAMNAALLKQVVEEQGSIRKAAKVLDLPRSTLGAWLRRPASTKHPGSQADLVPRLAIDEPSQRNCA